MATYEYTCPKCNSAFEVRVSGFNPPKASTCPTCGHKKARRKLSKFATTLTQIGSAASATDCAPGG